MYLKPLPSNIPPINSGPKQPQHFGGQGMPSQGGAGPSGGNFKTAKCKYFEKGNKYGSILSNY